MNKVIVNVMFVCISFVKTMFCVRLSLSHILGSETVKDSKVKGDGCAHMALTDLCFLANKNN